MMAREREPPQREERTMSEGTAEGKITTEALWAAQPPEARHSVCGLLGQAELQLRAAAATDVAVGDMERAERAYTIAAGMMLARRLLAELGPCGPECATNGEAVVDAAPVPAAAAMEA
jgi:hypothetical protein